MATEAPQPIPIGELHGEDLKLAAFPTIEGRVNDALKGVEESPIQPFVERSTVGPYPIESITSEAMAFLSDSPSVVVIACGRNENEPERNTLVSTIQYAQRATGMGRHNSVGNVLYADGNSTDGSLDVARELGATAVSRGEVLQESLADPEAFAEVLGITEDSLQRSLAGQEIAGDVPFRKGIDVTTARIQLLRMWATNTLPKYALFIDTDLNSIPGGKAENSIVTGDSVYHPIEIMGQGLLDLNMLHSNGDSAWALFTGSGKRNNESIFTTFNMFAADAEDEYLTNEQRGVARALSVFPGTIMHPLTGELAVRTDIELGSMGATGQGVEVARLMSLAGGQYQKFQTASPEEFQDAIPLVGSVRRGKQERIDASQPEHKEWWMIAELLPDFVRAISIRAIREGKLPHNLGLDDYAAINRHLARVNHGSRGDTESQTRKFDRFPMERAIPPVALLHSEGIIKV